MKNFLQHMELRLNLEKIDISNSHQKNFKDKFTKA